MFKYMHSKLEELLTPLSYYSNLQGHYYHAHEDITTYSDGYGFFQQYKEFFHSIFFDELLDYINDFFSAEPLISLVDSFRYPEDACSSHSSEWSICVNKLNHEYRYSNSEIISLIKLILSPAVENGRIENKYLKRIKKGSILYRGRIFNSNKEKEDIKLAPFRELGPPPVEIASEQRMTPSGISAFYGALDRKTCQAELRPIVGVKIATCAFKAINGFNLIDLDVLKKIKISDIEWCQDPFKDGLNNKINSIYFFSQLYSELVKPATLGDTKTYRLTQLFFEVLRIEFLNQIHGITFSSVQRRGKGRNVVLFPEYSVTQNCNGEIYYPHGCSVDNFFPDEKFFSDFKYKGYSIEPVLLCENESINLHSVKEVKVLSVLI
ncbi:RES domain-containing protein [Dickeya zeae]|uniref:RES domain-containing protein n=1 Tax=Dickeya zeae TaxID=204042 RepID=UPI0034D153E9